MPYNPLMQGYNSSTPTPFFSQQPATQFNPNPMTPEQWAAMQGEQYSSFMQQPVVAPAAPIIPPITQQGPPPVTEADYIPGYLASMIGRNIKAEFVVGTNQYVEKVGMLLNVGVNFFVLLDVNSRTTVMCDLYSVKFVTVIY